MTNTYQQNTAFQYIIVVLLFFIVTLFFYIKLKYPFWNSQPVYHIYDYWRVFYREPRIIRAEYPSITKYCNFTDCTTIAYQDATPEQIRECVDILQTQYLRTEDSVFVFNERTMDSYMTGHIYSSYISVYLEPYYPIKESLKKVLYIRALMTSRSIRIKGEIPVYYWDFICSYRELPIKRTYEIIQTHNYRTRIMNPDIKIGLFKRVGKETEDYAVVPVVKFSIMSYRLDSILVSPPPMPKYHLIVDINRKNIADVLAFLEEIKPNYEFWAISDMGNIESLLLSGVIYGYMLSVRGQIRGLYFFRDSRIFIENIENVENVGGSLLELAASINQIGSQQIFYNGFLHAVFLLSKQYPIYKTISIENIGDNQIIENLYPPDGYIMGILGAYYFYNYFYRTVASSRCFILL